MGNALTKAVALDATVRCLVYLLAVRFKTENFYDASGCAAFVYLLPFSLMQGGRFSPRQVIQSQMVGVWAVRLGLFLACRMLRDKVDTRYSKIVSSPQRLLMYSVLQGLWVWLTLSPTLILNQKKTDSSELTTRDYSGWIIWFIGFLLETISDYQRYTFRSDPANRNRWIGHGVWSIIRHPNYLGEILVWLGLFVSASSTFNLPEYVSGISLVYVVYVLVKLTGISILERRNLRTWKNNALFMEYFRSTYRLIPWVY